MANKQAAPSGGQATPAQLNAMARMLIQQKAVRMQQQIFSQTYATPSATPIVTVNPRNVGLILGWYVQVTALMSNGAGSALVPTDFGGANMLTNISFVDLENNQRINTPGWHLSLIDSIKARRPYGCSLVNATGIDGLAGYGANFSASVTSTPGYGVNYSPQIGASSSQTWSQWYWIPCSYSEQDLRGAIYANVVNATMQLSFTFNPTPFAASVGGHDTLLCAAGNATGTTMTNATITVHQVYLDQLPRGQNGGVILPMLDISTVYELKQTTYSSITASQDFPMDYPNFRDFLSTCAIYDNGTTRVAGTDVNYWLLQSANFTNIWKMPPGLIALQTRNQLNTDVPKGVYYFGSRNKPIATVQYGNMQLVGNFNIATAGATIYLAYEDFALKNAVTQAGSIQ